MAHENGSLLVDLRHEQARELQALWVQEASGQGLQQGVRAMLGTLPEQGVLKPAPVSAKLVS